MKSRRFFNNFIVPLENFLAEKEISASDTSVINDALLAAASVTGEAQGSYNTAIDDEKLLFKYLDISEDDASKVLKFLKDNEIEVQMEKIDVLNTAEMQGFINFLKENVNDPSKKEALNTLRNDVFEYSFIISQTANEKLVELLKKQIDKFSNDKLNEYKQLSEGNVFVNLKKLDNLLPSLMQKIVELEKNSHNEYVKGALHVIFSQLGKVAQKEQFDILCGMQVGQHAGDIALLYSQYKLLFIENSYLNNGNEVAAQIKQDFKAYRDIENKLKGPSFANHGGLFALDKQPNQADLNEMLNSLSESIEDNMEESPELPKKLSMSM